MSKEIPEILRHARRKVLTIPVVEILQDLTWDAGKGRWLLHYQIECTGYQPNEFIPAKTKWYALISPDYPFGEVSIFPALQGGITGTFQHQLLNKPKKNALWTEGEICVETSTNKWGRSEFSDQPYDPELRLWWYVQRSVDWLTAAAAGTLAVHGEPFEMPPIPYAVRTKVVFNEDETTLKWWQRQQAYMGNFVLKSIEGISETFAVMSLDCNKEQLKYGWGKHFRECKGNEYHGIWVMLNDIPVLEPWEIPSTWGQLFTLLSNRQLDLHSDLIAFIKKHAGKQLSIVALGFPIPKTSGEPPVQINWEFVQLPHIALNNGFRSNEARNLQKAQMWFGKDVKIGWTLSENWNKQQISSRGSLDTVLQRSTLILVGAGALGSLTADILGRLGCEKITVVDPENLVVGNLSRHSLNLDSVWESKAAMVAEKLNNTFPFTDADAYEETLEVFARHYPSILNDANIVFDLTGDDEVICQLSHLLSDSDKHVISISLGLNANRIYCYVARPGHNHDFAGEFFEKLSLWLAKDKDENKESPLLREGIGCWHPIFPARLDDISMLLNAIIRPLELILAGKLDYSLVIAERTMNADQIPTGIMIKYE